MHTLRSQFHVSGLDPQLAYRCIADLRIELAHRPWLLRPAVDWDDRRQLLLVALESILDSDSPAEPPVLLQQKELLEALRACTETELHCELDDSRIL